ncbi:hypothetical protein PRZ48_006981 [Zasmidium cellare]|uniref:Alcohol dehydrogenase n=1 Tax=Zasmidium cellare TaxID=395010 RepID=A0ABR0EIW0_ZASCE|nr:hypothetical protein PRZ48_006981 [Zasmidium cellare]
MKAVIWDGRPGHVSVRHVPKPQIQKDSELLIRITTAAICGTDLHTYHGIFGADDVPYILGHEGVGVVAEVGKDVTDYKPGDRVIVLAGEGFEPGATNEAAYGLGNILGTYIGGLQAEYAIAPDSSILRRIPSGFDNELDYVLLSDIFATGWWSITQTGFEAGDVVAVYGAGPMGLLAAYSALLRGASKVYSIDRVPSRLAKAKEIGAIPIDLRQGLPSEQILKLEPTGVKRVSDCCGFECVNVQGSPDESFIVNDAIALVSSGGGIALTGVYWAGPTDKGEPLASAARGKITFDVATWWLKNVSIKGGIVNLGVDSQLQALVVSGKAKPSFVFDKIVSIEEAPEAYELFNERKIQKAAIRFFP